MVTPRYFDALGIAIRCGRVFSDVDLSHQNRVVVNEALAHELFSGEGPVGRRIAVGGGDVDPLDAIRE